MFKKFNKEEIHSRSNIKSSAQRALRTKFISQFPLFEKVLEEAIPKKGQLVQVKCADKLNLYSNGSEILFSQHFNDDLVPSLRLVHKYPTLFPSVQVDRGAIKFVLGGANIMCPGLTSKGARLPEEGYEKGQVVAIYAEGKENALAVGILAMSTDEIKSVNKGIGIELVAFLGDGLVSSSNAFLECLHDISLCFYTPNLLLLLLLLLLL